MKPHKPRHIESGPRAYGWCLFDFRGEPALGPAADALFKAFSPKRLRQPLADPAAIRYFAILKPHTLTEGHFREVLCRLARRWPDATSQSRAQLKTCRDLAGVVEVLRSAFGIDISEQLAAGLKTHPHDPDRMLRALQDDPGGNLVWTAYAVNMKFADGPVREPEDMNGIAGLRSEHIEYTVSTQSEFDFWSELETALALHDESFAEAALADMVSNLLNAIRDGRVRTRLASRLLAGAALTKVDGTRHADASVTLH